MSHHSHSRICNYKMKGGLLLDIIVQKSATVLELLASKVRYCWFRRNPLLVLNLRFDVVNGV